MAKRTQTTRRLLPTNCFSVFNHFVGLALKGLILGMYLEHHIVNMDSQQISALCIMENIKQGCNNLKQI